MLRRTAGAAAALALLLAACPQRQPPSDGGSEAPVRGGTLRVALRDLGTLDPARAAGRGALLAVSQVFDTLTAIDPLRNVAVPATAVSWKTSSDGLRWRFRLARDATYSDGTHVTAADFKLALDRAARKKTSSVAAFQLEPVLGFNAVHIQGTARTLKGVVARAKRELAVTLARPFAELPYVLAHPAFAPLEGRRYAKPNAALATRPIGNGPFRVLGSTLGERAVLVRNARYRGQRPYLDRIELVVVRDLEEAWRRLTAGEIDVAEAPSTVLETARSRYGRQGFTPQWATLSFGPNLRLKKYASPIVRRAISLAIDREAIAGTIFAGTKDPATGLVPRGVRGYVPEACDVCHLDRERARRAIAAAFGSKRPQIVIDHLSDRSSRDVARKVASDLSEVGFRTSLRAHTPSRYRTLLQRGRQDFAELGWLTDVPTPDGFLARQLRTKSPDNNTRFSDGTFDRLISRARKARDETVRLALYRRAEARALERMPLVPIVFFRNRTVVAERVRGFVLDGAGVFDAARVWIAA